ncbi:MAG TPA: hypothetical protein PKB06_05800 [Actinotalea sp.]|nr:hypothetical protein [Actinotalea sp.]
MTTTKTATGPTRPAHHLLTDRVALAAWLATRRRTETHAGPQSPIDHAIAAAADSGGVFSASDLAELVGVPGHACSGRLLAAHRRQRIYKVHRDGQAADRPAYWIGVEHRLPKGFHLDAGEVEF